MDKISCECPNAKKSSENRIKAVEGQLSAGQSDGQFESTLEFSWGLQICDTHVTNQFVPQFWGINVTK